MSKQTLPELNSIFHQIILYLLAQKIIVLPPMQAKASKPYFIQLYSPDNVSLKNKYKFVLGATTVKELKQLIRDKLISKKDIEADTEIAIKDIDDFQLASDDEVDQVIPDAKVKIYTKNKPVPLPSFPNVPSTSVLAPASLPAVVFPLGAPASTTDSNLITKHPVLDLTNLQISLLGPQVKTKLSFFCPQIRKTLIEIPFDIALDSYIELSNYIVKNLGLDPKLKAILYNRKGQPFIYNLDLFYTRLPKLDFSETFYVVFTASPSVVDQALLQPVTLYNNVSQISIVHRNNKYNIDIDLQNTISVLKYKIFKITQIHPNNQIIKFANKPLSNNVQTLKSYSVIPNSILQLNFKLNSNLVPCTFADKFYYKDIKHIREQTETSIVELRSHLLALSAHLSQDDKLKLTTFIRGLTQNMPLVYALKCLIRNNFISQTHRIALQEGLLLTLSEHIKCCTPQLDKAEYGDIFLHFRDFMDYVLEGFKKLTNMAQIKNSQEDVEIQVNCHFTIKPIKIPRFIKIDNGEVVLVDKEQMEEQILKGFTYPLLKAPKRDQLFATKDLQQFYFLYQLNQLDNPNTNALYWIGFIEAHPVFDLPVYGAIDKYKGSIDAYLDMKIHQPLQIKNKVSTYLLLKNKQGKLRVFVSKNKDIAKPYNIFNVFTGEEEAVNLDLMSANVRSQNVEQAIDMKEMKAVITRQPKEAIAILFDISGSMGGGFFNEPDLKRIGAVKSFFQAFAYRTIAYNLQHVVSLFFFDSVIQNQCGFTQAIYDFNRLISKASPRGSTLMYDACVKAISSLIDFKAKYPDCLLRIVALTDGEDTGSHHSVEQTTRMLIDSNIVIDSFAVGANCEGLKIISKASGGKCYLTRNLEESLKLFEQQTVLSVRARKHDQTINKLSVSERIDVAKAQPFDLPNNVHEFNMPKSQGAGLSAKDILKKMQNVQESKKISGNNSLKRIAKEIQVYSDNPHPFVAIYPCANINLWKILLLGPKETPYENGLFLLYAQFPGSYPFKAPEVRFITPIYHCNMNSQGRICHSVFDRNYSPALTFRQIIDCVYGLILTPEPEDPLDNVIASFYLSDPAKYNSNAIQFTKEKASMSTEKIVDELFGQIVDDGERKQKEKEIQDWITLAKSHN